MFNSVLMEKDSVQTLVNNNASVQVMEGLGWALVKAEAAPEEAPAEPEKQRAKPGPKPKAQAEQQAG